MRLRANVAAYFCGPPLHDRTTYMTQHTQCPAHQSRPEGYPYSALSLEAVPCSAVQCRAEDSTSVDSFAALAAERSSDCRGHRRGIEKAGFASLEEYVAAKVRPRLTKDANGDESTRRLSATQRAAWRLAAA